jgi:hypothetical protein
MPNTRPTLARHSSDTLTKPPQPPDTPLTLALILAGLGLSLASLIWPRSRVIEDVRLYGGKTLFTLQKKGAF